MKTPFRTTRLVGIAILASAATAHAQGGPDVGTASPDVMLLVDTSGSMELTPDGKVPACDPTHPNTGINDTNDKNRWTTLVEVLTGSIDKFSCYSEPRTNAAFRDEFSLGTGAGAVLPPDYNYFVPDGSFNYHRPLSNQCTVGPGDLPTPKPWNWPAAAVKYRMYSGGAIGLTNYCAPGTWSQASDGLLDAYRGLIRFGLMTFDTDPDSGTGVDGADLTYGVIDGTENDKNGVRGTWSYYVPGGQCRQTPGTSPACNSYYSDQSTPHSNPDGCCMGGPINCQALSPWEVGARNAAAPPWEGRMVAFGPPGEDGTQRESWIKDILRATRPFGSTPIAGMLNDARNFYWNDTTQDPLNKPAVEYFGPSKDPQVQNLCRPTIQILLTDGEPNMELRKDCEGLPKDKCPYDLGVDIVTDLANSTAHRPVRTYVVGFGVNKVKINGNDVDCNTLKPADCVSATDPALKTCCRLNELALAGVPVVKQSDPKEITHAFFAQTKGDLATALDVILKANGQHHATRTYPVVTTRALNDVTFGTPTDLVGYQFTSGYNPSPRPSKGEHTAILSRNRITCDKTTQTASTQDVLASVGDDFIATTNVQSLADTRTLFTVEPPSGGWDPTVSVRPYLTSASMDENVGLVGGVQSAFGVPNTLKSAVSAATLGVTAASCTPVAASPTACANSLVDFMAGVTGAGTRSRCRGSVCSVIGRIMHSTPQIRSGIPSEFLRDPTYTAFATSLAKRDSTVYVSSNDGFFHAFYLAPGDNQATRWLADDKHSPYLWGFVPPAALRSFVTQTPTALQDPVSLEPMEPNWAPELDGTAVLRDVGATQGGLRALNPTSASRSYYPYILERKRTPATNEVHTWRTVMAQAFGTRRSGYFAMDVTTPNIVSGDNGSGPKFLWQLTKDKNGNDLFSPGDPAPTLATVFADLSAIDPGLAGSGETRREVQVAILAGGSGGSPSGGPTCNNKVGPLMQLDSSATVVAKFRSTLPCWSDAASVAARSLTIVRMDTGQIVRTFRPNSVTSPLSFDSKFVTLMDIPAPISGQPAAYPGQAGQIADRVFVGDAEGRVWRVDLSDPDPSKWTMTVFLDLYGDFNSGDPPAQPIQLQPLLSVDDKGQITVTAATGDQQNLDYVTNERNYVASAIETVTVSAGVKQFNTLLSWRHLFLNGEHALGPMALFDRYAYYSTYLAPTPSSLVGACSWGVNNVRAEHYVTADSANALLNGGLPATGFPIVIADGLVTGAAIRQLPSCTTGVSNAGDTDPFLGYGSTTTVNTITPGPFQLFFQVSGDKATGPKGVTFENKSGNAMLVGAQNLVPPRIPVRVDSWAPIIE